MSKDRFALWLSIVAEDIAQARREGVLIGVRAGIEAAEAAFGPPRGIGEAHGIWVDALDIRAIAERACKRGEGK